MGRYKKKHTMRRESAHCFRSFVCHISRGRHIDHKRVKPVDESDWLCYFVQKRKAVEKSIYGCYNIKIQSGKYEFVGGKDGVYNRRNYSGDYSDCLLCD